jgi:hypothetical protein
MAKGAALKMASSVVTQGNFGLRPKAVGPH